MVERRAEPSERPATRQLIALLEAAFEILEGQAPSIGPDEPAGRVLSLPTLQQRYGLPAPRSRLVMALLQWYGG